MGAPVGTAAQVARVKESTRAIFAKEGCERGWEEFWRLVNSRDPGIDAILAALSVGDDVHVFAMAYVALQRMGMSTTEIHRLFKIVGGLDWIRSSARGKCRAIFESFSKPTSGLGRALSTAARCGKAVEYAVLLVEYSEHWRRGDYHMAFVAAYKYGMHKALPWTGMVDGLQTVVESLTDDRKKATTAFQILRALDPVGLGAGFVDIAGSLAFSFWQHYRNGGYDPSRIERLVQRLKEGPTKIFAAAGESAADLVWEMNQMGAADWNNLMMQPLRDVESWCRSVLQGGGAPVGLSR